MKIISTILILICSIASTYYMVGGLMKPETLQVYNKAAIPHVWIQLLSLFLGIGGILLLFPPTFTFGGVLLLLHSLTTIICFIIIKDWKGGFFEFLFMQIPIFLLWVDYPLTVFEKIKTYLE